MKIGFTGTRTGLTEPQAHSLRRALRDARDWWATDLHHGDCVGADAYAAEYAGDVLGYYVVAHPPTNFAHCAWAFSHLVLPPKGYLERDRDIVDATDMLIACPQTKHEQVRSGTWYTIRYARKVGRPVLMVYPDGSVEDETIVATA